MRLWRKFISSKSIIEKYNAHQIARETSITQQLRNDPGGSIIMTTTNYEGK